MRGRKPVSSAAKRLRGNPGKRGANHDEPAHPLPDAAFDTPPAELADNATAIATWREGIPQLRAARQITEVDRTPLVALCLEWSRYLDALKKIATLGMVVKTPNGYPMVNPYLPIATKALSACTKLWPELGLTPSSRSRLKAAPDPTLADPFAEFDSPPGLAPH